MITKETTSASAEANVMTSRIQGWLKGYGKAIWPLLALAMILVIDGLVSPTFFRITVVDGHYFGSLIDILKNAAPVMLRFDEALVDAMWKSDPRQRIRIALKHEAILREGLRGYDPFARFPNARVVVIG